MIGRPSRNQWLVGDVALGDGEEAGEPRLGGEQVVAALVELVLLDAVADRQQLALRGQQEGEVHLEGDRRGRSRSVGEPPAQRATALGRRCARRVTALRRSPAAPDPAAARRSRRLGVAIAAASLRSSCAATARRRRSRQSRPARWRSTARRHAVDAHRARRCRSGRSCGGRQLGEALLERSVTTVEAVREARLQGAPTAPPPIPRRRRRPREVAGEVAAVDAGYVERIERPQRRACRTS